MELQQMFRQLQSNRIFFLSFLFPPGSYSVDAVSNPYVTNTTPVNGKTKSRKLSFVRIIPGNNSTTRTVPGPSTL